MMKRAIFCVSLVLALYHVQANECDMGAVGYNNDWNVMADDCKSSIVKQVNMELTAALSYLKMGAFFSRDDVNKRGFAKFFFEAASEEREHAIKFIEYLVMRGELPSDLKDLVKKTDQRELKLENAMKMDIDHKNGTVETRTVHDGKTALEKALFLELKVTKAIRDLIVKCETTEDRNGNKNDYHFVDYLTSDFLDEQLKGQRELAGKISTLARMRDHYAFNEFLFDKKLLKGEALL